MGIFDWVLKNGPGSPGSTARAFVKLYKEIQIGNHSENWEGIYIIIFQTRYLTYQNMGFSGGCKLNQIQINQVLEICKGDFPFFIYLMMVLETAQFRDNVKPLFEQTTSIIFEIVKGSLPQSILLTLEEFQLNARLI